jgi:pathogenesis-related protein 1
MRSLPSLRRLPLAAQIGCGLIVSACFVSGCTGTEQPNPPSSTGGTGTGGTPTGGSTTVTGGSGGQGGLSPTGGTQTTGGSGIQGGSPATGGSPSTGGSTAAGGTPSGGSTATGGKATGGSPTSGGSSTTGGSPSGGSTASGGKATGGSSAGGTATGGRNTGGANTGGGGGTAGNCPEGNALLCGITDAHNQARANVSPAPATPIPPLTWSASVAADAQAWANQCNWTHNTQNDAGVSYGQDLYASSGTKAPTPQAVLSSWVGEASNYDYATNTCASGQVCGHYTQVVWRNSTSLGCGITLCTTGSPFGSGSWYIVVCDYYPPGNYNGQKPY